MIVLLTMILNIQKIKNGLLLINRVLLDGDYELIVLKNFFKDFCKHKKINYNEYITTNKIQNFIKKRLNFLVRKKHIFWNDEVYYQKNRYIPNNSIFFHGGGRDLNYPDNYFGNNTNVYDVSVAAMSLFIRPSINTDNLEILLTTPLINITKTNWFNRDFVSYLYLHKRPLREKMFDLLSEKSSKKIPRLKGNERNTEFIMEEAVLIQKKYKFSISMEHSSHYDYITEKIMNAYLAGQIPIYWGCPNVNEYFNSKSFINLHDFSDLNEACDYIIHVNNNKKLALEYLNQPPCTIENVKKLLWWRY